MMGLLDKLFGNGNSSSPLKGIVDYGEQKSSGGHDHRYNKGDDRTPAQKKSDNEKKK